MARWPRWIVVAGAATGLALVGAVVASNFIGGEKKIQRHITRLYTLDDPRFMDELGVLLGPPFLAGTRVQALLNGEQIFPPMLAAIQAAERSITFETYIYWSGDIGRQFAEALAERARQGVKVHVLLDWVGSVKMDDSLVATMAQAGVQVQRFHPPHWSHLGRMNNRTHRKLLIVDGRVGFTGGVGVAPQWTGRAQNPEHWRFSSSPSGGSESMQLMYLLSVTAASRSIDLSASYFVPDALTLQALVAAMQRGVRLRIIVPGQHIDSETVRKASRATWGPLLAAGAVIAEYTPTMYHCKVMIVDGMLVSVGSTNFDNRSFRLNDEATLNVVDKAFAGAQTATFEDDLAKSHRVTHAAWLARPMRERLGETLASLLGTQL